MDDVGRKGAQHFSDPRVDWGVEQDTADRHPHDVNAVEHLRSGKFRIVTAGKHGDLVPFPDELGGEPTNVGFHSPRVGNVEGADLDDLHRERGPTIPRAGRAIPMILALGFGGPGAARHGRLGLACLE